MEIKDEKEEYGKMFPNIPTTLLAIFIPWLIMMGILFFDITQGTRTNPLIIYGFPVLVAIVLMPKETVSSVLQALGLSVPTLMDKLVAVAGSVLGVGLGWIFYFFGTIQAGLIGLYFVPEITQYAAATGDASSIFFLYVLVSLGEEFLCILFTKVGANWLNGKGINKFISLLFGAVIARATWASMHWWAYGGTSGLPNFIFAFGLGTIFSMACIGMAMFTKKWYSVYPALSAHAMFDICVALRLAMIL